MALSSPKRERASYDIPECVTYFGSVFQQPQRPLCACLAPGKRQIPSTAGPSIDACRILMSWANVRMCAMDPEIGRQLLELPRHPGEPLDLPCGPRVLPRGTDRYKASGLRLPRVASRPCPDSGVVLRGAASSSSSKSHHGQGGWGRPSARTTASTRAPVAPIKGPAQPRSIRRRAVRARVAGPR